MAKTHLKNVSINVCRPPLYSELPYLRSSSQFVHLSIFSVLFNIYNVFNHQIILPECTVTIPTQTPNFTHLNILRKNQDLLLSFFLGICLRFQSPHFCIFCFLLVFNVFKVCLSSNIFSSKCATKYHYKCTIHLLLAIVSTSFKQWKFSTQIIYYQS